MDRKRVEAEAALLPKTFGLLDQGPQGLAARISSTEGLSQVLDRVVEELQIIAEASTPPREPDRGFQAREWCLEVQEATQEAKRAERALKRVPESQHLRQRLNQNLREQARVIKLAQTKSWRCTLRESSSDQNLLWRLERWARTKSYAPVDLPKLPLPFRGLQANPISLPTAKKRPPSQPGSSQTLQLTSATSLTIPLKGPSPVAQKSGELKW
ncbi:hypothetical protein VTI28DRAFT_1232 [Corynascus sepedonium]